MTCPTVYCQIFIITKNNEKLFLTASDDNTKFIAAKDNACDTQIWRLVDKTDFSKLNEVFTG